MAMLFLAEIPIFAHAGWALSNLIAFTIFNLGFSLLLVYWRLFSCRTIHVEVISQSIMLIILHPLLFGLHHWDSLEGSEKILALQCCVEFINLNFGLLVLVTSTVAAYIIARIKSDQQTLQSTKSFEWTLFTLNIEKRKFGSYKELPFIHALYWPLCIVGAIYLVWFGLRFAESPVLIWNLKIVAVFQLMAIVFVYRVGLILGEGLRIMQIEKLFPGERFTLDNEEDFLQWRHDYVKYHLPSLIRKMNLRIFNQHVEAYEQLLKNSNKSGGLRK